MIADGARGQPTVVQPRELRQRGVGVEASGIVGGDHLDSVVGDVQLVALGRQCAVNVLARNAVGHEAVADVEEPRTGQQTHATSRRYTK